MIESELMHFLQTNGFAVFVAVWFMFRLEKVMNKNTEIIKKLLNALEKKL